jgi:hypothetical protein
LHGDPLGNGAIAGRWKEEAYGRPAIASSTTYLLVVAVQVLGIAGVDHSADVWLVDADAEGGGGHHEIDLVLLPPSEKLASISAAGVSVKAADAPEAVGLEASDETFGSIFFCDVEDSWAWQVPEGVKYGGIPGRFVREAVGVVPDLGAEALGNEFGGSASVGEHLLESLAASRGHRGRVEKRAEDAA